MTMREACIIAAQDAIDANWRENPRMMATYAFDAILARLRDPDEAMVEAGSLVAVRDFIPADQFIPETFRAMLSTLTLDPTP